MELLQRFDQQIVYREPDRSAPVRVSTEQTTGGFRRLIVNPVLQAILPARSGLLSMNHSRRRLKPGNRSSSSESSVSTANSGIRPTMERTRIGYLRPSGNFSTS